MLFLEIVRTAGWLVGTILHGVLLAVLLEGRRQRGTEAAYSFLVGSAFLWHLGNLLVVFLGELTGERFPALYRVGTALAVLGLGLLPSTLLHAAVTARPELFARPILVVSLAYVPALGAIPAFILSLSLSRQEFLVALRSSPVMMGFVGAWFVSAVGLAARIMSSGPVRGAEDIRFGRAFGASLFALAGTLAAALGVELALGGGWASEVMSISVMLMSLIPGGLFFYYIYRYRYLDLTLRRGLSFAALVLAVFLAHSLVIGRIASALEERYKVDFALLEGAMVVGVVLAFEPVRRRLQAAVEEALSPGRSARRLELAALAAELGSLPPGELRHVILHLRTGLERIFGGKVVVVLRYLGATPGEEDQSEVIYCEPAKFASGVLPILAWSAQEPESGRKRPLKLGELPSEAALAAERLGIKYIVSVRADAGSQRDSVPLAVGFIGLGEVPRGVLGEEEACALATISGAFAAAVKDSHVVGRLVALEHKLAEAEKLSSLGRLAATIAHEVKNPLSSIKTIVGVLRESLGGHPQAASDLDVVAREVDRLSTVVTNLLAVARPQRKPGEGTALVPPPEGFDVREMIEGLLAVLGPDAQRRGLKLRTEFEPGTPRARARESAVRQAVFQLVLNAIELTPSGGEVFLSTRALGNGELEIVVEDTGPGLPKTGRERLFEPFFSTKPGGTGLGLALAKEEVTRAGGRIEASDRTDGLSGARFRIVLPAADRIAPT